MHCRLYHKDVLPRRDRVQVKICCRYEAVPFLLHTSNLYYNAPVIEAADKVLKASKMDRIFFTNSGTEAIEGAIKAAKKYAFTRDGHAGHAALTLNSFHNNGAGFVCHLSLNAL